jgi:hypothetical protein
VTVFCAFVDRNFPHRPPISLTKRQFYLHNVDPTVAIALPCQFIIPSISGLVQAERRNSRTLPEVYCLRSAAVSAILAGSFAVASACNLQRADTGTSGNYLGLVFSTCFLSLGICITGIEILSCNPSVFKGHTGNVRST